MKRAVFKAVHMDIPTKTNVLKLGQDIGCLSTAKQTLKIWCLYFKQFKLDWDMYFSTVTLPQINLATFQL